jgi:ferritin-like metal-binding protein YciE
MALTTPRDLFLYELSGMYDAEQKSKAMLGQLTEQVQDPAAAEVLRTQLQEGPEKIRNIEQCFEALGSSPQQVPCAVVDGMSTDVAQFMAQGPAPELTTAFAVGTAMKLDEYATATYSGLVDKAISMRDPRVADALQTNKVQAKNGSTALEVLSHALDQRLMTTT